jgi:tetratricopeptide (TPR) repeat protein
MEDPLLKKAEQEMARLDWSNTSLREAEQYFRRGQREYLNKNYQRAIEAFRAALSLYGGHLLADRYLRRAVYETEIEAKNQMATAIQYYESLQYARAIHHFKEVISLMSHRPNEPIVKEAGRYIQQAELRLQAAELFP